MSWYKVRGFLLIPICMMITACSSVEYVSSRDVQHLKTASFVQDYNKKKQFGALVFKSAQKDEGHAFVIRKDKSSYVAETLLSDKSDDNKAKFKRTYFSFGTNKDNSVVGLKLRFTY